MKKLAIQGRSGPPDPRLLSDDDRTHFRIPDMGCSCHRLEPRGISWLAWAAMIPAGARNHRRPAAMHAIGIGDLWAIVDHVMAGRGGSHILDGRRNKGGHFRTKSDKPAKPVPLARAVSTASLSSAVSRTFTCSLGNPLSDGRAAGGVSDLPASSLLPAIMASRVLRMHCCGLFPSLIRIRQPSTPAAVILRPSSKPDWRAVKQADFRSRAGILIEPANGRSGTDGARG